MSYHVSRYNTADHNDFHHVRFDHNTFTDHAYNGNHESFLSDSAVSHVNQYGALNINASPVTNAPIHDNDFSLHLF
ncbi:MAG TPA: hypothetical protein VFO16_02545 [Pseudonocardiaceae bacterium]|nr:hypothetical protein [Pseudonocardiaceae bacterium]